MVCASRGAKLRSPVTGTGASSNQAGKARRTRTTATATARPSHDWSPGAVDVTADLAGAQGLAGALALAWVSWTFHAGLPPLGTRVFRTLSLAVGLVGSAGSEPLSAGNSPATDRT